MSRAALVVLLAVVAAAAAVLSFAALRDLALVCGFAATLAWLLPVVLDAGAAAGSLVWLTQPAGPARAFGRRLALALLGSSVAGNAVGHLLAALAVAAPWPLVVAVSGLAPAILAAVVHLAVLTAQARRERPELAVETTAATPKGEGPAFTESDDDLAAPDDDEQFGEHTDHAGRQPRAAELIAAGAGRRRLARELDLTEYEARRLLAASRNGVAGGAS